jgi:hypothetical protein
MEFVSKTPLKTVRTVENALTYSKSAILVDMSGGPDRVRVAPILFRP